MKKTIIYELRWKCNGIAHSRQYDSANVAQICYDECKSLKAHSDVTLSKITCERISTTEQPKKRLRVFAVVIPVPGTGLEAKYYELKSPEDIVLFTSCLRDKDLFEVSFRISDDVPQFIRRKSWTLISR